MAIVRIVTKKEQEAEERSRFRLVCEGVSKEEFTDFMKTCERFECKIALRNPFPGAFTPKDVHEIIAHVTGSAIGGYAAKKAVDAAKELFVAYVKFKWMNDDGKGKKRVALLCGPNDEPLLDLKRNGKRKKKP